MAGPALAGAGRAITDNRAWTFRPPARFRRRTFAVASKAAGASPCSLGDPVKIGSRRLFTRSLRGLMSAVASTSDRFGFVCSRGIGVLRDGSAKPVVRSVHENNKGDWIAKQDMMVPTPKGSGQTKIPVPRSVQIKAGQRVDEEMQEELDERCK